MNGRGSGYIHSVLSNSCTAVSSLAWIACRDSRQASTSDNDATEKEWKKGQRGDKDLQIEYMSADA